MITKAEHPEFIIKELSIEDYDAIYELWYSTKGIGLRTLDDSREGIQTFLQRNPKTNFVAVWNGRIVGTILGGHDGRRGYIYHACVGEAFRGRTIGSCLLQQVKRAMAAEGIHKLALVARADNEEGNKFWVKKGWEARTDLNYYTISLNENNR